MMRIKTTVYLLSGLLLAVFVNAGAIQAAGSVSASNSSILIKLTPEEKTWLVKHKNIRLGVDPAWPPFEFFDAAKVYSGIASGYVHWLNEQLHINMVSGSNISWSETMKKARFGGIDVLPCVGRTPNRGKFLLFTKPYLSFPMVIITRQDALFVNGVLDFDKGRVAVVKGYVTQDLMERVYPDREFFPADNVDQALKAVSRGKLDAFVGNLPAISYGIQKLGLTNLKVATTTPYRLELGFAVRKDWPQLVGILNKSLATMPETERNKIHNRWINIHFEEKTNWTLIFQLVGAIVLVAGIILIIIIRWNRALRKEVTERKRTAAALRDSRAAARGLLDATRESLFFLDGRGNVVAVNTTAALRFQRTPEEITGTDFFELLPAEVREERRAYFDQVMQTGAPVDFEGTHAGIVMQIRFYPVKDKSGGMSGVAVFAQDITERKQAEETIINSEQRLSQIIDFMPDPAWVVDNDGKVVTWNRAVEKLTGIKAEKILGKGDFEYALPFYGERRPVLIDLIRQWNSDYEKKYVSVKKDGENLVSESFHPNLGDHGIFLSAIAGLLYDTSGEVTGAIESLRDITDQKKAEMELQKLSLAVEQSPASVVITDPL
jgi:two-component system sensor histidine kinase/response regulator